MSVHHQRRCSGINSTLGQCLVFDMEWASQPTQDVESMLVQRWPNFKPRLIESLVSAAVGCISMFKLDTLPRLE